MKFVGPILLFVVGMLILLHADSVGGMEITPAACYAVAGENVAASGQHQALILNTCTGAFKWVRIPEPPKSEV